MLAEDTDAELTWRNRADTTRTQRLSGQHFIFIEAGIPRSMQWDKEAALICLFLSDDFLENLELKHLWQGVQIRRCYELAKGDLLIWHLAYILENLCTPGVHNAEQLYVDAVGRILATHLLRVKKLEQCRTDSLAGLTPAQIKQVRSYIHGHLREPIRVQTLARTAGVSKDHFIILFKNTIGMTPHRYILLKRLQLAQQLIERGKLRTSEIAVEAGFCDQSHMSRCFRKLCSEIARESTRQNGLL